MGNYSCFTSEHLNENEIVMPADIPVHQLESAAKKEFVAQENIPMMQLDRLAD